MHMQTITPEPHCLPGYGGHCPQFQYYIGETYGKSTHRALLDPCIAHSKEIILTPLNAQQATEIPSATDRKCLKDRERFVDAIYRDPMVPGYQGFVPRLRGQIGKRQVAAATTALAEHEAIMDRMRCERHYLQHSDLLQSGAGVFERTVGERLIPTTKYRSPLLPVTRRRRDNEHDSGCHMPEERTAYSKFSPPHFQDNNDDEKWIIYGYGGHIPRARFLIGMCSKLMTHTALNEFSDEYRRRRYEKLCGDHEIQAPTSECGEPDCEIYRREENIVPFYGGHVPGRLYQVGKRFAVESKNAKDWLEYHKMQNANGIWD